MKTNASLLILSTSLLIACNSGSSLENADTHLKRVSSCREIDQARIWVPNEEYYFGMAADSGEIESDAANAEAVGETNTRTTGVDELDTSKARGDFLYHIEGEELLVIRRAPFDSTGIVQRIDLGTNAQGIFLDDDHLLVLSQKTYECLEETGLELLNISHGACQRSGSLIKRFRVLSNGKLDEDDSEEREINTSVRTARKIGNRLHLVSSIYLPYLQEEPTVVGNSAAYLPRTKYKSDEKRLVECSDVYTEPRDLESAVDHFLGNLTCVYSLRTDNLKEEPSSACVASGYSHEVYASTENLYLSSTGWYDKGSTHQFSLASGEKPTTYRGTVNYDGSILNSFSIDEHEGYLRIASTNYNVDAEVSGKANTANELSVYKLTKGDPRRVASIDNIAPGERIYAARFMGKQAFLVTFKKVDPLFAIDFSNPEKPIIRGELKIPGYSSYLHPMAEGYLMGIGKDAEAAEQSDEFAWFQGMALSIFDVRDLDHPTLIHKIGIGSRGTSSEALYDHKAFRYIPEEELVVFPISLYEGGDGQSDYGDFVHAGFHIYRASIQDGFSLEGTSLFPNQDPFGWWNAGGRSFCRDGGISLLGGGEFVLRDASHPDTDISRISLQ